VFLFTQWHDMALGLVLLGFLDYESEKLVFVYSLGHRIGVNRPDSTSPHPHSTTSMKKIFFSQKSFNLKDSRAPHSNSLSD
jgi:hypothetical protein